MHNSRNLFIIALALLAVIGLSVMFFIAPNYARAAETRGQIAELHAKIAGLESQTQVIDKLKQELSSAQKQIQSELKTIPDAPDVAGLIRKLSQDVDHVTVIDQTFTAGTASDAIAGGKAKVQVMPLTVDMDARFDSVFALIRNAESLQRLVRVASVRVLCKRDEKAMDAATLKASVGLEAIFMPASSGSATNREER